MKRYIKRFRKHLLTSLICCSIIALNISFLSVYAAMDHAEYNTSGSGSNNNLNYRYDRYIWSNDGTDVEPVTVAGNTLYCNEYTIFEIYFMQPTSGQLRVTKYTGANLADFTFYINGGVFNGKMTNYMNVKFTNITHLTIIITTYNNAAYADPTKVFTLSNFTLSEPTNTTDSTLNDIDVLLQNVDYTLQDILGYINGSNGILDYLDQIETYSEYLQNISLDLSDIDNTIDTISWFNIPISYKGATNDYVNFNTSDFGGRNYYFTYQNVDINDSNLHAIYKFKVPLAGLFDDSNIEFYTRTFRGWKKIEPLTMIYRTQFEMIIYFIMDNSSTNFLENQILAIYFNDDVYANYRTNYSYSLQYITQDDIEYWTLRNTMYVHENQKLLQQIVDGITDNSATTTIDSITSDLNDQITDSNAATSSTENILQDFNQNLNLNSYAFDFSNMNGIEYFKLKLTNIYDINEFKPFYIIPIILFILGRILAG